MSHEIKMLIGCVLPLVVIMVLPLLGVSSSITVFIVVVMMFACHLGMMGHHRGHRRHSGGDRPDQGDSHGHAKC